MIVLFDKLNVASCFIDEVTDGVGLPPHTASNCIRQRDNSSHITVDGSLPIRVAILSCLTCLNVAGIAIFEHLTVSSPCKY